MLKILLLLLVPFFAMAQNDPYDILIKNGKIIDGTGNNWWYGDVAIKGGFIVKVGKNIAGNAVRVVDAGKQIIAPGFIDVHAHIEDDEKKEPTAANFIYDGVTTVITGNCGLSKVDVGGYLAMIDSLKTSVNVAVLVGHNDVRRAVLGMANRYASDAEQLQMEQLVAKAMLDGAVGMSTGLIYIPGTYSSTQEVVGLAKVVSKHNGVYASHIRDEGDQVAVAIEEALHIGRQAVLPVQISHFKLSGQQNWGRSKETIGLIEKARKEGLEVTIDQYPYTASSTAISTLLPDYILADGADSIKARLSRPVEKKKAIDYMLMRLKKRKLKHFSYAVVANYRHDQSMNGKSVEEINLLRGRKHRAKDEAETVMEIMLNGGASAVFHGMGDEDVKRIMQYPFNMFASDASIRIFGEGVPHPRGYGTNARVLGKYVREEKVISLEEAIRRMTSLPAQKFQIAGRGLIKEGMVADIVVFDADEVKDLATFEKPHAYATGFSYVIVNGAVTVAEGKHTGERNGKAIYGPATYKQ